MLLLFILLNFNLPLQLRLQRFQLILTIQVKVAQINILDQHLKTFVLLMIYYLYFHHCSNSTVIVVVATKFMNYYLTFNFLRLFLY
jgi:hypothetical protein